MKKESFVERELIRRGIVSSPQDAGQRKKAERKSWEDRFLAAYEGYMRPTEPLTYRQEMRLQEEIFEAFRELHRSWVKGEVGKYTQNLGYSRERIADCVEDGVQTGCMYVYEKMMEDRAYGNYMGYALPHYLDVAQKKTIDHYFRKEFGRLLPQKEDGEDKGKKQKVKKQRALELDGLCVNGEGQSYYDYIPETVWNPFEDDSRPDWAEKECVQTTTVYIQSMMDLPEEPPQLLAAMYGCVLFQLAKVMRDEDELTAWAKKSTARTSAQWAFRKMGDGALEDLGIESENTVQKVCSPGLHWGDSFAAFMEERCDNGKLKWADIIYTSAYSSKQTSGWMESINDAAVKQTYCVMKNNARFCEYAVETWGKENKFRRIIEKGMKEERK